MKPFLNKNFLLENKTAERLYHEYAAHMPIIDYHNHLPPQEIADDKIFENISRVWLNGDHYKWRAMRTNGMDEQFVTGNASDRDKFKKWAETVPYTLRNPLYHWTHLELQRYFGVEKLLSPASADEIYDITSTQLNSPAFSVRNLLRKMNVRVVCTTDDPVDDLAFHRRIKESGFEIIVRPAFRPDAAMNVTNTTAFNKYVDRLQEVTNIDLTFFNHFMDALKARHDFFAENGCTVSDHGLNQIFAAEVDEHRASAIYDKVRGGAALSPEEQYEFSSFMLHLFAIWDHEKGWVQQYHLGALRNNNSRLLRSLGPDTGWDSIGDFSQAQELSRFLNRLDAQDKLTKTIIYNLNPADNEVFATMIGNFNDGSVPGKIQWGSGWWFLDQKQGMINQINALSNMGLLSRFVGMLTDSRSFLSFPRHEYFRRLLCNLLGTDVENGELPNDMDWIGQVVRNICFNNANSYFNFNAPA